MATTWEKLKSELNLSKEDKELIELEEEIISTMVQIREEKGMTQAQLAELCRIKQSSIARMEKSVHSPQLSSLLKILVPLGYTLQIVPIKKQ